MMLLSSCLTNVSSNGVIVSKDTDFSHCDREKRLVTDFNEIINRTPFVVIFTPGEKYSVTVEGNARQMPILMTLCDNGRLTLRVADGFYRDVKLRVLVSAPDINTFIVSGSGQIECKEKLKYGHPVRLELSGSGDIELQKLICSETEIKLTGSGDIEMDGLTASSAIVSLTGSGDIDLKGIDISRSLRAQVTGSGDIKLSGQARFVEAACTGSGDIEGRLQYEKIEKSIKGSGDIEL